MAKKHTILWSGPALEDLRDIRDYVKYDRPQAAKKLARRIRQKVLRLERNPQLGRVVPELEALGYREVIVSPYRIVYTVQKTRIIILRVWHGRMEIRPGSSPSG